MLVLPMIWKEGFMSIILAVLLKALLPDINVFTQYGLKDQYINHAIEREKEIKGWLRAKKDKLISEQNPSWDFLNKDIMDWPPVSTSA